MTQSDSIIIDDQEPCAVDLPLVLGATLDDFVSAQWSGGASPSSAINSFDTNGSFEINVLDAFGCLSSDSFNVTALEEPNAVIKKNGLGGTTMILSAENSEHIGQNTTFYWDFGPNSTPQTSTQIRDTVIFPWPGSNADDYTVKLVVNNFCGVDEAEMWVGPDWEPPGPGGIGELESVVVRIAPNPAQTNFEVKSNTPIHSIRMINKLGQTLEIDQEALGKSLRIELPESTAPGLYLIELKSEFGLTVEPLIIY